MKSFKKIVVNLALSSAFVLILLSKVCFPQSKEKIYVDQISIPIVSITEPGLISFFLNEFMIPETDVTKIEVIDAMRNGFGEKDLLRTYPSNEVYFLEFPSDSAQRIMNSWEFQANFQIVGENRDPSVYDSLKTNKAPNSIFTSLLRGLNRNYKDWPMKIRFERDSLGVTFEMWGYNQDLLEFVPPPPPAPDSVVTYDVLHVVSRDTLIVPEQILYDCIYVYKTVSDTVYVLKSNK